MKCTSCRAPVKPVVAIDIDGTLGDYHWHFITFANGYLNRRFNPEVYDGTETLADFMGIDMATYRQCKLAYRQGGMKRSMPVVLGAKQLVDACMDAGAEAWLTTTRPYLRLDNIDPDTREWLARNGIDYDGLLYDEDKYSVLCDYVDRERIVGVLDDLEDNYDRAEELGLPVRLIQTQYNRGIQRPRRYPNLLIAREAFVNKIEAWKEKHGTA